jgi:hypothetical protein
VTYHSSMTPVIQRSDRQDRGTLALTVLVLIAVRMDLLTGSEEDLG